MAIESYFRRMGFSSRWEVFVKTYKNHVFFAQAMVDRFALFFHLQHRYKVRISGNEAILELLRSEKGAILLGAHVGNMEMAGYFFDHHEKDFYGIVSDKEVKFLTQKRILALSKHKVKIIPVSQDMSHVFVLHHALEQGSFVTLHSDRTVLGNKTMELNFLGAPAHFPVGAFRLALQMNVPVLAIFMMRVKSKKYHIIIRNLSSMIPSEGTAIQRLEAIMVQYISILEEVLRQYPEQWYNYYDFWKVA